MKEKMKGMTFLQKIEYLWMYYKIWLLVPVVLGFVLYIMFSAYRASQENEVVSVIVVGSVRQDTDQVQEEIKEFLGTTQKHDIVRMHMNIPADQLAKTSQTALTTLIGAEAVDVILCPEDVYQHFSSQDGFVSLEEYETQINSMKNVELCEKKDAIKIKNSNALKEKFGTPYNEVYMGIFMNAPHKEGGDGFVQFVLKNQ